MATLTKNCDGDLTKKIPCENKHIIDMTKMELNLPCQKWSKNLPWPWQKGSSFVMKIN